MFRLFLDLSQASPSWVSVPQPVLRTSDPAFIEWTPTPAQSAMIFDHGRVADAAVRTVMTRVTTGIIIGASDLTASNASMRTTLSVVHRQLNYRPSRGVPIAPGNAQASGTARCPATDACHGLYPLRAARRATALSRFADIRIGFGRQGARGGAARKSSHLL
jgi:hypothetical protein